MEVLGQFCLAAVIAVVAAAMEGEWSFGLGWGWRIVILAGSLSVVDESVRVIIRRRFNFLFQVVTFMTSVLIVFAIVKCTGLGIVLSAAIVWFQAAFSTIVIRFQIIAPSNRYQTSISEWCWGVVIVSMGCAIYRISEFPAEYAWSTLVIALANVAWGLACRRRLRGFWMTGSLAILIAFSQIRPSIEAMGNDSQWLPAIALPLIAAALSAAGYFAIKEWFEAIASCLRTSVKPIV